MYTSLFITKKGHQFPAIVYRFLKPEEVYILFMPDFLIEKISNQKIRLANQISHMNEYFEYIV